MEQKFNAIEQIKKQLISNKLFISLFALILLKVFYSYCIPLNYIPGAPHDDSLFYRLGLNISEGAWLGKYENTTLIKGVVFPLFLATSFVTKIPVRVLEALMVCGVSLYFVMLFRKKISKNLLLVLFGILIFYPFQYGAVEFRLLRDMIYPQLLLLFFGTLFYVFDSSEIKFSPKNIAHFFAIGFYFFLFQNTREEGVWILPALIFVIGSIFIRYYLLKKVPSFLVMILISGLSYSSFHLVIKSLNHQYYNAPIINIWKDKNFQNGYASLQRLSANNLLLDHITFENWNNFSKVSPSVASLKPFINEETYKGWISISCSALKDNGYDIESDSGCYHEVIVSYSLFALNDALTNAGYNTPSKVSIFMGNVASEIDAACDEGRIKCNPKPFSVLPAQLFYRLPDWKKVFSTFLSSISQTLLYQNPSLFSRQIDFNWDGVIKMREKLGGYIFANADAIPQAQSAAAENEISVLPRLKMPSSEYGYVDGIINKYGDVIVYGWALNTNGKKFQKIKIFLQGKKLCEVSPSLPRPDISHYNPEKIGFTCSSKFDIRPEPSYQLHAYAIDDGKEFLLRNTQEVETTLSNNFNEACYLKYNEDVMAALKEGRINSGKSHWLEYGKNESRRCAPIYSENYSLERYQKIIDKYGISKNIFLNKIFDLNSFLYFLCILVSPITLLIFFCTSFFKKDLFAVLIVITFLILCITRLVLLSFLHYYGVAQASSLYLLSGAYSYFIAVAVSIIFVFKNIYAIRFSHQSNKYIESD